MMRLIQLAFALSIAVQGLVGCTPAELDASPETLAERITRYVGPHVEDGNFSGSIAVTKNDSVLALLSFAPSGGERLISPRTRHHVASISKAFSAFGIMLLLEDGLISPTDPVARFIPDFPNGEAITIHHLLTHTSGIPDINRFPTYRELSVTPQTPEGLVQIIAEQATDAGPGSYRYSNSDYNLLAHIIEVVSDQSYGAFMEERVFDPLGMTQTAHSGSIRDSVLAQAAGGQIPHGLNGVAPAPYLDWSIKTGNGSIVSTVMDVSHFLQRLVDRPLLRDETMKLMLRGHVDERYAYGWFVSERFGRSVVYMNGNTPGVSSSMEFYPDERVAVVVLANHDVPIASRIGRDIAGMVFDEAVEFPKRLDVFRPPEGLSAEDYVGHYPFGIGFDITAEAGAVIARGAWPQYPLTLIPTGDDVFFHRFWAAELRFERNQAGEVTGMTWEGRLASRQASP